MSVEQALTDLLAGAASGRRYWGRAENVSTAEPYLVLNRIDGIRDYTLAGASGYVEARFQIDAYAETFGAAIGAAASVISILSGYSGEVAGTRILGVFVDDGRDLPASDAGEVSHLFRRSIDVIVHHGE